MQSSSGTEDIIFGLLGLGILAVILLAVLFLWGTVFKKAGYSFWTGLLMFIPLVNLVWLLVFAFSKWPIQRQLEEAQQRAGMTGGFPVTPNQR